MDSGHPILLVQRFEAGRVKGFILRNGQKMKIIFVLRQCCLSFSDVFRDFLAEVEQSGMSVVV